MRYGRFITSESTVATPNPAGDGQPARVFHSTQWGQGESNLSIAEKLIPEKARSAIAAKACRLQLTANRSRRPDFEEMRRKAKLSSRQQRVEESLSAGGTRVATNIPSLSDGQEVLDNALADLYRRL